MDPVGVRVLLRDASTLDDLGDVTAPAPVEPGDLLATVDDVFQVDVVLTTPPGSLFAPVLARRLALVDR
jgi:hypothetical protein